VFQKIIILSERKSMGKIVKEKVLYLKKREENKG